MISVDGMLEAMMGDGVTVTVRLSGTKVTVRATCKDPEFKAEVTSGVMRRAVEMVYKEWCAVWSATSI